jgi:hypothetical protein
MTTNENGNLLDSSGNVVVDFVWGGFPLQPNDVREESGGGLLNAALDNHSIAYEGWNGYPLYTPNTVGAEGVGFIVVRSVIGETTTNATDIFEDAGLVVTVGSAATNTAKSITRINVTSTTAANVYTTTASTAYPVGTKVTIGSGTGIPAALVGTWTVTNATSSLITSAGTGWTVADTGAITPAASLKGVVGTIKTQSLAPGANSIAVGAAVTIVAYGS